MGGRRSPPSFVLHLLIAFLGLGFAAFIFDAVEARRQPLYAPAGAAAINQPSPLPQTASSIESLTRELEMILPNLRPASLPPPPPATPSGPSPIIKSKTTAGAGSTGSLSAPVLTSQIRLPSSRTRRPNDFYRPASPPPPTPKVSPPSRPITNDDHESLPDDDTNYQMPASGLLELEGHTPSFSVGDRSQQEDYERPARTPPPPPIVFPPSRPMTRIERSPPAAAAADGFAVASY